MAWLTAYWLATPGVELADNTTVRLDGDNEPQPDILLRLERGGQSWVSEDDYVAGAPELAVETAASSAAYDLHDKKTAYRRNGVQEYIVWQMAENKLNWFWLCGGEYVALEADEIGIIRSKVFPGLWLDVSALLTGNLRQAIASLQQGLDSPEHELAAELAFLCGDFEGMEQFIELAIAQTHTVLDRIKVYRIRIASTVSQHKLLEAITIARGLLQELGINLPTDPTEKDIRQAIAEIEPLIGDREIEDLVHLPIMNLGDS